MLGDPLSDYCDTHTTATLLGGVLLSFLSPSLPLPSHSLLTVWVVSGRCTPADSCPLALLSCNIIAVTVAKGLTHRIAAAEQKAPEQDRTSNGAAPEGLAGTIQHMTHWPQTLIVSCSCVSSGQCVHAHAHARPRVCVCVYV